MSLINTIGANASLGLMSKDMLEGNQQSWMYASDRESIVIRRKAGFATLMLMMVIAGIWIVGLLIS